MKGYQLSWLCDPCFLALAVYFMDGCQTSWLQDHCLTVGLTLVDTGCISTLLFTRFFFVGFDSCSLWMAINPRGYKTVVRRGGYGEGGKGGRAVVTLNINKLKLLQSVPEVYHKRSIIFNMIKISFCIGTVSKTSY